VDRRTLVAACVVGCLLNAALVTGLAGLGVLKTAQPGDVSYERTEETPTGSIVAEDRPYAIERPTDVDAFYNAVIRVRSGGPMYNPWGKGWAVQKYHYAPPVYFAFLPLYFLGYVGFKIGWLLLSIAAVTVGTYLLLRAEQRRRGFDAGRWTLLGVSVAAAGFAPMVANFKSGQTTPVMFLFVAVSWWLFRRGRDTAAGAALVGAPLVKPYFAAPLIVFASRDRWRGLAGFGLVFAAANLLSVAVFGAETLLTYYRILLRYALEDVTNTVDLGTFGVWNSNDLRVFAGFGPLGSLVRLLAVLGSAYVTVQYVRGRESASLMFATSLVGTVLVLRGTTMIDAGMLLAVFVVFGAGLYCRRRTRRLTALVVAFLLFQAHPYVLEALGGWGAANVGPIASREGLITSLLPYLQPGVYALLILAGLLVADHFRTVTPGSRGRRVAQ